MPEGGGVQRCTREYLRGLKEAGLQPEIIAFKSDMHWLTRIRRNLRPKPYVDCLERGLGLRIAQQILTDKPSWIFFNHCDGLPVLEEISASVHAVGSRVAYLSHGLDSTDYLHYNAPGLINVGGSGMSHKQMLYLGAQLFAERSFMQRMDLVCCLAPTDIEIHRWLGAGTLIHLPRVVDSSPVDWHPLVGRFGTISTLVHAPNFHGLDEFCNELKDLDTSGICLRLIGRPEAIGHVLEAKYSFVEYLGGLSDAEVEREAATWVGFVNPIFAYPRGCSTKLSAPLEWRIPIYTSRPGARGYYWDESMVPLADSALDLAKCVVAGKNLETARQLRGKIQAIADGSPTWDQVGNILRVALSKKSSIYPH